MTTERMKLGEQLNCLFNAFLTSDGADRVLARHALLDELWENKAGIIAALRAPEADAGAVVWQWRSRFEGGEWDAWETGRCCEAPPGMEVEERASPSAAGIAAPPAASADAVRERVARIVAPKAWAEDQPCEGFTVPQIDALSKADAILAFLALTAPVAGADAGMRVLSPSDNMRPDKSHINVSGPDATRS